MNFTQLEYFLAIAKERNFTRASETLYISQPTLSIQIKELEKEVGAKLFVRNKRGAELTRSGYIFYDFALKTTSLYKDTLLKIKEEDPQNSGHINIGAYWMFGYNGINKIIHDFKDLYSNIDYTIMVNGAVTLMERVVEGKLDGAFITWSHYENDEEFERLNKALDFYFIASSPLVLLAHRDSDLAKKKSVSLNDLNDQNLMQISKLSNLYHPISEYMRQHHIKPKIIGHSSQADICLQVAEDRFGYAFVTKDTYDHYPNTFDVLAIPLLPIFLRSTYFITKKDDPNKVLRPLVDFITKQK